MQILKQVVGIDVSKDSLVVCIGDINVQQEQRISSTVTFKNNSQGHKKLLSWALKSRISEETPLWFVMEATGIYYENLAFYLAESNQNVAVLLPNKSKNFSKTLEVKSKTDSIDAKILARFGLEKQLKKWEIPPEIMRSLKSLTREYHNLKDMSTQVKNQIHAKKSSYNPDRNSLVRLEQQLSLFKKQEKQILEEINLLIDKVPEMREKIAKIDNVKGIGLITIVTVLAETNCFALINNQKQLTSYAGMDVVHKESGFKKHKTCISKKGNKHLRKCVFMPALVACRFNQKFKQLYIRLSIKKNNKKVAQIAVARKLLVLIYSMWKNNLEYNLNYKSVN